MQLAKITEKIKQEIKTLNKEEKTDLIKNFIIIVRNIEPILGLPEPLILIVDNQILIDLNYLEYNNFDADYRRRYIRRISIFLFFNYLLNYAEIKTKVILIPTILFEFNQRTIPKTKDDFNNLLKKCLSLLKEFGVETLSWGLEDFQVAKRNFQHIEHDEQKTISIIKNLKQKEMAFQLFDKLEWHDENNKNVKCKIFNPPFLIANQIVFKQKIRLKYFNRNIVNRIIASHLEPIIYSDSAKTAQIRQEIKIFRNELIKKTASVSKIKKEQLKRLADIEMLQFCNIDIQFRDNTFHSFFAIIFDDGLSELLHERTRLSVCEEFSGQDNVETRRAKLERGKANIQRIYFAKEKQLKAIEKLSLFYQHLEPLIC